MQTINCPYCHTDIPHQEFEGHLQEHLKLKEDGQHQDYISLPEEDRHQGSLEDVPQVYQHPKCGVATQMPDEIVRSYLENPYLYAADRTFCCGCEQHVPIAECIWTETGENVQVYMDKLRAAKPELKDTAVALGKRRPKQGTAEQMRNGTIITFGCLTVSLGFLSVPIYSLLVHGVPQKMDDFTGAGICLVFGVIGLWSTFEIYKALREDAKLGERD